MLLQLSHLANDGRQCGTYKTDATFLDTMYDRLRTVLTVSIHHTLELGAICCEVWSNNGASSVRLLPKVALGFAAAKNKIK